MRLLLILALAACGPFSAAAERQPNVILFVTDDQSPIAGCYGNRVIRTPHLDALAAEGTRFTHAFATTASCSASRSVILSGLHNHRNGQYGHTHAFHKFESFESVAAVSLPLQMAQAGYRTASIGKYHVAPERVFHFDHYLPGNGRNAREMAGNCKALIGEESEQPFFIYFCTSDPHRGGGTDKNFPGKHKPDLFGNKPDKGAHKGIKEVIYSPADVIVPEFLPDTPECRAEVAHYYQSCSRIDQGLGHLVQILKDAGKWDNTVLIFTADHGMAFPGGKTTVYEAGLRVPFVVRHPQAAKKGVVNNAMISHVDITPSILDLAGAFDAPRRAPRKLVGVPKAPRGENYGKVPKAYHGRSWIPILSESNPEGWDSIDASHTFHEIQMYYPMRVVRDRNYKLIWNVAYRQPYPFASDLWAAATWQAQWDQGPEAKYGGRSVDSYINRPQFEFFDISSDPSESRNLAADPKYAGLLETYKAKVKEMQKRTGDPWIMKWSYE
ncbi:MAG: sulfatase [Akkermansiaceae bacterium]|nr:sulfatase [Akkermansiaceae bacterium]NNM28530.1 sulfatase [Akkermansiaceae bacterium]